MPTLTREILNQLIESHQPPCVSIYLPVSAAFPGEMENNPRFDDLLKKAEAELKVGYPAQQVRDIVEQCRTATGERGFWSRRMSGLAVFYSPDLLMTVDLPRQVPETMIVADSFHTKPLIRLLQTMDRFQVLCITRKDARLLEGDRDSLSEVALKNVPHTIGEAYDMELNNPGPNPTRPAGEQEGKGQSGGMPATGAIPLERWFRTIDAGIWEHHSRFSHLPLILCALPQNQSEFRGVSKNQYLVEDGIQLDPDHVPLDRIREEAWKVMEPQYMARAQKAVDNFRVAKAHHAGDDDVFQVATKAAVGRIQTLLVEADRHVGGKLDPDSGQVLMGDISDPMLGDLLDDTAESVLRTGGDVWVMPPEMMPTDTGIAAVYRY